MKNSIPNRKLAGSIVDPPYSVVDEFVSFNLVKATRSITVHSPKDS